MKNAYYILIIVLGTTLLSCDKFFIPENDTTISTFDEDESHYVGKNCMDCHHSAGEGEGWFTTAGSITGNTKSSLVELFLTGQSTPKHTIEVDKLGNFYTTEPIDFSEGFTVAIKDDNNNYKFMSTPITNGQCNLCHGSTTTVLNF